MVPQWNIGCPLAVAWTSLPAGAELWAAVAGRRSPTRYHPQGDSVAVAGAGFSGNVYVGNEDSTGSFRLLLVLVDNALLKYGRALGRLADLEYLTAVETDAAETAGNALKEPR